MYIISIYSKLDTNQKRKILVFLMDNFKNQYDFSLENNTIIVLELINDNIVGCICLLNNKYLINQLIKNNILKYYSMYDKLNGCFIYNFCVSSNMRNQKIGTNLLGYTIEKMKEINIDYLHSHAINNISKKIFLKHNFIEDNNYIGLTNNEIYSMIKYL
jgi:ribosomal protein S18 acetylase RimI-like enzyme